MPSLAAKVSRRPMSLTYSRERVRLTLICRCGVCVWGGGGGKNHITGGHQQGSVGQLACRIMGHAKSGGQGLQKAHVPDL